MDKKKLEDLLDAVRRGEVSTEEALAMLKHMPFADLGFAKLDNHRALRQGFPEVIYSPGKTVGHIVEIAHELRKHHDCVAATRAEREIADAVLSLSPEANYHADCKMIVWGEPPAVKTAAPHVVVLSAGTSDLPVAEEAALVCILGGLHVDRIYDVGVAGLHRLLEQMNRLTAADVAIVVAGMDGALPSVVAGILAAPVIAVPTSVGYGANFQGLSALLAMLNSCAAGLVVVNIDNGFAAGMAACRFAQAQKGIVSESRIRT